MDRILVVDDDEAFAKVLCRSLERRGFRTEYALDGAGALALAESFRPGFAVLDLRLGEESGLRLIGPLLERSPDMRIVVLTGYASLATAVQAVKLGALDYLAKPVDAGAVVRALMAQEETEPPEDVSSLSPTPLKQLEWEHLQRVLAENGGNVSATARQLGMHRRTLQRKLQKKPRVHREVE